MTRRKTGAPTGASNRLPNSSTGCRKRSKAPRRLGGTRPRVEVQPLLGLSVARAGDPNRLTPGQRLQNRRGDVARYHQWNAVGAFDAIRVLEAQHPGETALVAHDQAARCRFEQSLP